MWWEEGHEYAELSTFDLAWREINALIEKGIEGDKANRLRNELAKTIIAARNMEPAMIKETVLYKIRTRKFGRSAS